MPRFERSLSDELPTGPLRPDDETAWKAVAKNYDVTNKITNLENGYALGNTRLSPSSVKAAWA
jgi:hypothetical protein